jgi:hypothetical protein
MQQPYRQRTIVTLPADIRTWLEDTAKRVGAIVIISGMLGVHVLS